MWAWTMVILCTVVVVIRVGYLLSDHPSPLGTDRQQRERTRKWDLLSFRWVLFRDQVGRTPCAVYVSELQSTGTIMDGTACALQGYCGTCSGSRTRWW
jgi:hypothetical protein